LVWPGECDQLTQDILKVLEQAVLDETKAEEFRRLDEVRLNSPIMPSWHATRLTTDIVFRLDHGPFQIRNRQILEPLPQPLLQEKLV